MHPDVTPAEVLGFSVSILGFLLNAALLALVLGDLRALLRAGRNGAKRLLARTAVGVKLTLTLVQLVFVSVGLFALVSPPINPDQPVMTHEAVVTSARIVTATLLAGLGVYMHARRILLLKYLSDERDREALGTVQHVEVMTELRHNTAVTEEAREEAVQAKTEATVAQANAATAVGEAAAAREEAARAKTEAKGAHDKAAASNEKVEIVLERMEHTINKEGC